jgi:hypothetical protein
MFDWMDGVIPIFYFFRGGDENYNIIIFLSIINNMLINIL